jgi:DNA-binding CsgD family transcriptional regulator
METISPREGHDIPVIDRLSRREREVVAAITRGGRDAETAASLGMRTSTYRTHWRNILGKLGAQNRLHVMRKLTDAGFDKWDERPLEPLRDNVNSQVPPRLRFQVLERDHFRCVYCGLTAEAVELHVDHKVPRSRGGRAEIDNLVTACVICNIGKSDRPTAI